MRKKFRPADEEIGPILPLLLFPVLWYSALFRGIAGSGFQVMLVPFLVAGLLPVYSEVNEIRRAMFYRKQRADAVAWGHWEIGRIRGIIRKDVPYYSGKNHRLRYRRSYCLQVEITDPDTGAVHTVESGGYRFPVHRYLASDRVRVYTDRSGWKYYLEEFDIKKRKSDPGVFDRIPMEYEETAAGSGRLVQIIFIVILVMMIWEIFAAG